MSEQATEQPIEQRIEQPAEQSAEQSAGGFQFNGPTVVGLLYLATWFTVFSALLGVILAYAARRPDLPEWQQSQLTYLIRTFWLGLGGYAAAGAAGFAAIALDEKHVAEAAVVPLGALCGVGGVLLTLLLLVRSAAVIVNAQQGVPMARPRSWLV